MKQDRISKGGDPSGKVQTDMVKMEQKMQQMQAEQNLGLALVAGLGAGLAGSITWAIITIVSGYQIGWMAVGVGFLVGIAIRRLGRGVDTVFGVIGALCALGACVFGNLLTVCILISEQEGIELVSVLNRLNPAIILELMTATFSAIDLLFYGIAVYEGYKLSFRTLTQAEIAGLTRGGKFTTGYGSQHDRPEPSV